MADEKDGYFYTTKNRKVVFVPKDKKSSDGAGGTHEPTEAERERLKRLGISDNDNVVKVDVSSHFQKKLDAAETPKERQALAFRYIMDNLCGEYTAKDGRTVSISSVGADKITHRDIEVKLRVSPSLADLIQAGTLQGIKDVEHKKFVQFAYYKVAFQIGDEKYIGMLNVGIRQDGSSSLYDLNPFNKQ